MLSHKVLTRKNVGRRAESTAPETTSRSSRSTPRRGEQRPGCLLDLLGADARQLLRGGADDYYAAQGEGVHRAWHACGKSAEAPAATFAPYRPRGRSCVPGTVLRAVAREFGIARSPDVGHPFPRCPRGGVSGQLLLVPPR